MTHEQKPESAEFRTREAQVTDLAFEISDWKSYDDNEDIPLARAHLIEAEARGAAEQRRKDAEGAEPVAYRWAYDVPKGRDSLWHFGGDLPEPKPERPEPKHVTPLYTRPANVAALEARVKELEGENKAWSDAAANALIWLENGRQANARDELKAAQRRAAAIRKGGEHG